MQAMRRATAPGAVAAAVAAAVPAVAAAAAAHVALAAAAAGVVHWHTVVTVREEVVPAGAVAAAQGVTTTATDRD